MGELLSLMGQTFDKTVNTIGEFVEDATELPNPLVATEKTLVTENSLATENPVA